MNNPYLLYIGSAYPHKNIPVIFEALKMAPNLRLILVSSRTVFLDRLKETAKQMKILGQIDFAGFKTDKEIAELYKNAVALVHPSKSEGFGLTGLEAMHAGCPVISSNATCLPEVYGEAALFFDPNDSHALISHINALISDQKLRNQQIQLGHTQAKKYSWDKMVEETLGVYYQVLQ